jgi:hypothetical protein
MMPPLARPKTVARISPKLRARAQRAARAAGEMTSERRGGAHVGVGLVLRESTAQACTYRDAGPKGLPHP